MAEIEITASKGHGKRAGKKPAPRIDFTPMVDLGFLLITFFIYTTSISRPGVMQINMPYNDPIVLQPATRWPESASLTVLLGKNHAAYYYDGMWSDDGATAAVKLARPGESIRDAIIALKAKVAALKQQGKLSACTQAAVLIKPGETCTYGDLVNILDEMLINGIMIYAVVDITGPERNYIAAQGYSGK